MERPTNSIFASLVYSAATFLSFTLVGGIALTMVIIALTDPAASNDPWAGLGAVMTGMFYGLVGGFFAGAVVLQQSRANPSGRVMRAFNKGALLTAYLCLAGVPALTVLNLFTN